MLTDETDLAALGVRLKILRAMAGLKRLELAGLAGVSKTSLSYWENGKTRSISLRSMRKILKAIEHKGVFCNEEWLLTERGEPPKKISGSGQTTSIDSNIDILSSSFEREINQFLSSCGNQDKAAIVRVENDSMNPQFEKGDILGGVFVSADTIDLTKEKFCIIKIHGKLDVRRVRNGNTKGKFNLSYLSRDEHNASPFEISDISLEMLAPIVRVWR